MFKQLIARMKSDKKREKVAEYFQELKDRQHELDRQEDNIAAERLYIERQLPRLAARLAEMEWGGEDAVQRSAMVGIRNVIMAGHQPDKPIIPQPGVGRRTTA
ncbi:hypothetical protein Nazgul18 [Burkholderia phage BcepNazgul]|uniref:Uncharacterized protein n=1 Tax=Burkholderia phage BcepNazgul TaxID=242861 RepID=Q6UYE7_9CAUD|nr:hypothetical protein Nazgul18 [Burkholderia phage BcepNazgul]AAQ63394.1 hypothetical protein Nazgul18 [Burkholderia phage BcepNazgul]